MRTTGVKVGSNMDTEYKGFNVVICEVPTMRRITTIGRGSIPHNLKGLFTNLGAAQRAIDLHLRSK